MKLKIFISLTLISLTFNSIALAFNPKAVDNFNKGYVYFSEKKLEKAATEFKKVLVFEPANDKVHNLLGIIYREQKKYDEAKYYSDQAIKINPENDDAYTNLGNILVEQNKFQEALFYFNRAVVINPDNKIAASQAAGINKVNQDNRFLLIKN
jgi:tetratricopeptide (TPR) repeat protein